MQSSLGFFEIAHRYLKDKKGFSETPVLAIGVSGKKESFFHLKGAVEKILHYSNNRNFKFKETKAALFSDVLEVVVEGKAIGLIGKVSESLRKQCDLKESLFFAQLDINQLILNADQKRFQRFSPYPLIFRDVSLCLDQGIGFKEVEKIIKTKSNYLAGLEIVDIYKGKDISSETTAFTLRIFYQSSEKTLTSQEVDTFHGKIREALSQQRGLKLR